MIVYIFGYQTGVGPIPFLYTAEICYDTGMSFAMASNQLWTIFITLTSPYMIGNPDIGPTGTFLVLSVVTFIGFIFMVTVLKETKGLTDDECKNLYNKKKFISKEEKALHQ